MSMTMKPIYLSPSKELWLGYLSHYDYISEIVINYYETIANQENL